MKVDILVWQPAKQVERDGVKKLVPDGPLQPSNFVSKDTPLHPHPKSNTLAYATVRLRGGNAKYESHMANLAANANPEPGPLMPMRT